MWWILSKEIALHNVMGLIQTVEDLITRLAAFKQEVPPNTLLSDFPNGTGSSGFITVCILTLNLP